MNPNAFDYAPVQSASQLRVDISSERFDFAVHPKLKENYLVADDTASRAGGSYFAPLQTATRSRVRGRGYPIERACSTVSSFYHGVTANASGSLITFFTCMFL